MKFLIGKFVLVVLAVLALFGIASAETPDTTLGPQYYELVTSGTNVRVTGTVAGTIATKVQLDPGWSYYLSFVDSVGAAADSAKITAKLYGSDNLTQTGEKIVGWSLFANARYGLIRVPIGTTLIGKSITLTYTRIQATNKTNLVRWELYKVRPLSMQSNLKSAWK